MIVRIMEENQFRLEDEHLKQFEIYDDELQAAITEDDHLAFLQKLGALVEFVHANGAPIPYSELVPSDVVIPAADMTLEESKELFPLTAEGPEDYA